MSASDSSGTLNRDSKVGSERHELQNQLEAFGNRGLALTSSLVSRRPFAPRSLPDRIERFARFRSASSPVLDSPFQSYYPAHAVTGFNMSLPATPALPSTPQGWPATSSTRGATPKAQTETPTEWTLDKMVNRLDHYRRDIRDDHSLLTGFILESCKATERRVHQGPDLFAGVQMPAVPEEKGMTMRIKFKQHLKARRDQREVHYKPIATKTDKDRVPPYRFHHVEIRKNVLTPNTMLTFVPHLRDLESSEETKYNMWLQELEDIDLKSGFKPLNREDKQQLTVQSERAAIVSLYLDHWLEEMAVPGCNKSALISYMAAREPDNTITPRQKTDILNSHRHVENAAPGANKIAKMFTDAFQLVFGDRQPAIKHVDLRRVLMLDESVDNIMDSKPIVKDATSPQHEDEDELAEFNLATYCILGCMICFSHSCDHGEYDNKNMKRTFSISSCSHLSEALKIRRQRRANSASRDLQPCRRHCYRRDGDRVPIHVHPRPWSDDEKIVLRSIYTTATHSTYQGDPICLASEFLNRSCEEVHAEFQAMGVALPQPEPLEASRVKNLSWYDRRRKILLGDWQDHTLTHAHSRRENLEPCSHEGPCAPRICTCVDADVLCDKFCGCTVDSCAYKFTGCACHSQGKTCQQNKKDKPCICVQLNRECDPQLCGSCGALERADPLNANDADLHATGCQNCDLQRGVGKSLVLGQSQLEGVGYGLFTAEDIAQDEFIIEYVGELITHDEGVRREARRGDVFDEESNVSYVFTLLENEGIWVDAAIYGNLSRYINHASEHDTRGCNVTPRILYVNGEYRIKFTALRDIGAGEELFFNYGENFPNLTKKLLDDKAARKPQIKSKGTRTRGQREGAPVARKASGKTEQKRRPGRPRVKRDLPPGFALAEPDAVRAPIPRKRKRTADNDNDDDDDDDNIDRDYGPKRLLTSLAGSARDRDSEEPRSDNRLRRRVRMSLPATPTKRVELPKKTRGKRGGARPGSGRPRKHPRPVPKPSASESKGGEPSAVPRWPLSAASSSDTVPKATSSSTPNTIGTPEPKRVTRRSEKTEAVEIEDSEDDEANSRLSQGSAAREPTRAAARRSDEDEDEDVLVRQRLVRSARVRRRPLKLRDEEGFWT